MNFADIERLALREESEQVEFKKSTAQLGPAAKTLCAFLNGQGGRVVVGVTDDRKVLGQVVADKTRREIAAALAHFEPPASVDVEMVDVPGEDRKVIVLSVERLQETRPFVYDGRAYQRVQSTTSVMPQERYERMLLERAHARRRWENQAAVDVTLDDLDHEEILRTREAAIRQRRISAGTSAEVGDILDRLGLRRGGVITQAAQILYGTRFLPDYPQGMLKMGRFRGTRVTGQMLDNRQEHLHAFGMIREAMSWLDRTLPLAARFPPGEVFREDRLPVPPDALREVLLNAVMHRDYSRPSSYVAVAVFDDRLEVRSMGALPSGLTAESLSREHRSVLRNPLIAEVFHRTGAVEVWGRGTNRVVEECQRYGIEPPVFVEAAGFLTVTFRAQIGVRTQMAGPSGDQVGTKWGPSEDQVQVLENASDARTLQQLLQLTGRSNRTKFRESVIKPLLERRLLTMTIPEKPRSSQQRYQTTGLGERLLEERE